KHQKPTNLNISWYLSIVNLIFHRFAFATATCLMRQVKISAPVSYWHLPNAMIYLHQKFWPVSGVIIVNFSAILRATITKTFATLCAMAGAALSLRENHFLRVRSKFLCLIFW